MFFPVVLLNCPLFWEVKPWTVVGVQLLYLPVHPFTTSPTEMAVPIGVRCRGVFLAASLFGLCSGCGRHGLCRRRAGP